MNELRCSEVHDLLAGYAAAALDEDERCSVASHLAECRNHDTELTAVRADFERIALAAAPVEPPTTLRSRLLDAFDREVAGAGAPVAQPNHEPTPIHQHARRERPRLLSYAGFGYALAAAMLVVAIGIGAWGLSRESSDSGVITASASEAGNSLELTYVPDEGVAVLDLALEEPPEGSVYQAWQIVDGAPVSLGVLDRHSGQVAFDIDLGGASEIALSLEPSGGSAAPTTTPILVTALAK